MDTRIATPVKIALIAAMLVVVVVAQNAASAASPSGTSSETGRLIGRAGFAYLTGIRTYVAAVLWNRLEPQYHMYYSKDSLRENTQLLPTTWLVQTLDPQFVQAYYNAAWLIAERGDKQTAFALAREGIKNNPKSGLLRASYIQLLIYDDMYSHREEIIEQTDAATSSSTFWLNDAEKFEGYAVLAAAYRIAGQKEKGAAAQAVANALKAASSGGSIGGAGHDHDGDGKPDH